MASSPQARTKVFISYSHKDAAFLERLRVHLASEVRAKKVDLWDDTRIQAGAKWRSEIQNAIQSARVAVLLVSGDFLASDFIANDELPPLLSGAESDGVIIIPVLLKPCRYKNTRLGELQFVNRPLIPFIDMSEGQSEAAWVHVADVIMEALDTPVPVPVSPPVSLPPKTSQEEQEDLEQRYRKALLASPAITKLQILTMNVPLPISSIYVRLQVHEDTQRSSARSRPQEANDPMTMVLQREKLLEGRFRLAMDPADALRKYSQCIILGDPGAGKTTLLKYLTIQCANKEWTDIPTLPVYIPLNAFVSSGERDLLAFAAQSWEKDYGIKKADAQAYIEEQIAADNALFLLDALDETAIGDTGEQVEASYKRVAEEITHLSNRCSWIVVTARKAGYQQRTRLHAFAELEVLDFRQQEIEQFIENWFHNHPKEERRGYAFDLKQELRKNPRIQTLAANPLLLTLITLVYEEDMSLPERRSTLYKKCVDTLLTRWNGAKNIRRPRSFSAENQKQLLQEIAWHFHAQRLRYFPEEKITPVIADFLPKVGINASQASDVLKAISGDDGLLREQAEGVYGFFHLTLQEYFISLQVKDVFALLDHVNDPWWEEVILLYAGEASDATPLLEHLLVAEGPGEIPEDIFSSKLILAGRCLATHPTLQNIELWNTIPNVLFRKLLQTEYALTRQQVANTIAEVGRAFLERDVNQRLLELLTSMKVKATVKICIAAALGDYGARELAPDLLEFFVQAGTTLDAELRDRLGEAIMKLADRSLLSRLLDLVSDKSVDPLMITSVAYFIGRVGDASTAMTLLPLLSDTTIDMYVRAVLTFSVGFLGDAATISSLIQLIPNQAFGEGLATSLLLALSSRDYRVATPELLALLAQEQLSDEVRIQVASTLSVIGDQSVVAALLPLVSDPALGSDVRKAYVAAFAFCALRTRHPAVFTLLSERTLDRAIRMHIAFMLAFIGDRRLLAQTRSVLLQERDEQVRIALMIASGALGDDLVSSKLQDLLWQESIPEYLYSRVLDTVVQHMEAATIMSVLTNAKIKAHVRVALAQALAASDRATLVPDLLDVVANSVVLEEVRMSVAEALGLLGEKKDTVERLLTIWRYYELNDPLHVSVLVETIYQALWTLSRRAGVSIVRSGVEYKVLER